MQNLRSQIIAAMPNIAVDWITLIRRHRLIHGQYPRIFHPRTFNEKILRRSLLDRRAIYGQVADKWAVRSYVQERLGAHVLPEVYCVTAEPRTIPFSDLPSRFVIKPTHGSGWIQVVHDKARCDQVEIIERCEAWLKRDYYQEMREIPYRGIPPRILVQEFIDDGTGAPPPDYRFFVFGGRAEVIRVDAERVNGGPHRCAHFTRDWQRMNVHVQGWEGLPVPLPRPHHLESMLAASEKLGKDFDFIRVDLFSTPARFYFGELTCTPGAGGNRYNPKEFDRTLGDLWKV